LRLESFGWTPYWESAFEPYSAAGLLPGRVLLAHRGRFFVASETADCQAEPAGKLRRAADSGAVWPVTGDWVALDSSGAAIEAVLPRRTCFLRKEPGKASRAQALAANVEVAFLVTSLDGGFNVRRLERYLFLVRESGARPVVVLNKTDLCVDLAGRLAEVRRLAPAIPVVSLSALADPNVDALTAFVQRGETAVLLGSSGVGKSTLVNRLCGVERQATQPIREHDARGRHTTTERELIRLAQGWLLMDTPGIRELQLWTSPGESGGLDETFSEIREYAERCRFRDCRHEGEPGCEVAAALERSELDPARLANYRKMQRELDYLERRRDSGAAASHQLHVRRLTRNLRRFYQKE
jgi:ribosome biogenesis GTPase